MDRVEIVPAVLSPDKEELRRVARVLFGLAKTIQLDVCDGVFVGTKTWPYSGENTLPKSNELTELTGRIPVEVDLMANSPESVIAGWASSGALRIIIHAESTNDLPGAIKIAHEQNIECGIAISIATPLSVIEPFLNSISVIQCMGIRTIGWQGEPFERAVVSHIKELRRMNSNLTISVDGGVSHEHVRELVQAGANRLAVGSTLIKSVDMKGTFAELDTIANAS